MRKKVIIAVIAALTIFAAGLYFTTRGDSSVQDLSLAKVEASDVQIIPDNYDIGRVVMKNGIVTRE